MNVRVVTLTGFVFGYCVVGLMSAADALKDLPAGWTTNAPRDEIKPVFRYEPSGGRAGHAAFVIAGDERDGTSGWWQKKFEVEGGKPFRFSARRKTDGVDSPRQSGLVRVLWRDAKGNPVKRDEQTVGRYLHGSRATAEPEYPNHGDSGQPFVHRA